MAQSNDPNQTIDQSAHDHDDAKNAAAAPANLDHIDSLILAEDPEFAKDLLDVSALPVDGSIDLDVVDIDGDLEPLEEENPWEHAIGFRKFLKTVFPFLATFWLWRRKLRRRVQVAKTQTKNFILHLGPNILHGLKAGASGTQSFVKGRASAFATLSRGQKAIAVVLVLFGLATAAFIYRSYTHGILPEDQELIMATLEEWSSQSYKYEAGSEMDSFYDSPRTIQNIMSLPKMIVNIRTSANSGSNPMAAMEFFLEGLSPEANVEVKDRESEIRDLFQRTLEDMSFDELDSAEGKQLLTERLRQNLNNVLSNGKIRRVYIKEAIVKP